MEKIKMQEIIKRLCELKERNLPVYIAGHLNPDDDSIGSCLALAYLLESLGNECFVLIENKDKNVLKNYTYSTKIVDSVNHNEYIFIAMDLNETYRLNNYEKYYLQAKMSLNIDHHQGNTTNADYVLSMEVSSTCEIVYKIIEGINPELLKDKNLCQYLFTGIITDTNGFSRRLSDETLIIAQTLINSGLDYEKIIQKTIGYRTLNQYKALSKLVNELQNNGLFHYVVIDKKLPHYADLEYNEIVKILAEELRKIDGIDILLVLIVYEDKITAKVASNISQNAYIIAELFGGGGHKGEAGFTTTLSVDQILAKTANYLKNK